MHKLLFLEYKFREFRDEELLASKPTGIIVALEDLNQSRVEQIDRLNIDLGISISLINRNDCPVDSKVQNIIKQGLSHSLKYNPDIVWFDQIRFPGKWEIDGEKAVYKPHKECRHCKGINRKVFITEWAKKLEVLIPSNIKTGYFAVPYQIQSEKGWIDEIGQDHQKLGNIFNYVLPMLYHRMLDKPVEYIHQYVNYLYGLHISAEIIPAIQIKDMPDDVPDKLSFDEIQESIEQAIKPPSKGVVIFSWDQAVEKNKVEPVSRILKNLY